jgi:hypothetical protein
MNGFQISMKNTTIQDLNGTWETGLTTVYSGTYAVAGTGWLMITLQTPFSWDGSNLLIQICFDNNSYTLNSTVNATPVSNKAQYSQEDLPFASGCNLSYAFLEFSRPNLKVNFSAQLPGCGTLTVDHFAGSVAPVNKTVTYSTVTNIPGESSKCWITKNLGATQQATSVNDNTEASAGWYWQFNRKQGYKHDGTTRTPNTTWISSISENSDWQTANDPCNLELGTLWRLPTYTEWYNVENSGGWNSYNGPWGSGLKLHAAGRISANYGSLGFRGVHGYYWGSTQQNSSFGWDLFFYDDVSYMTSYGKEIGFSVRCLRDN